jgi:hypothetical protein
VSGILFERLKARITGEWLEAAALGLSSRYFSAEGSAVTFEEGEEQQRVVLFSYGG